MRRILLLGTLALLAPTLQGQQTDPAKLSMKDRHQSFLVAADPYTQVARVKQAFGRFDPLKAGLLAVEVFFRNEATDPIHVDLTTIRLDIDAPNGQKFHLQPLSLEQAADEIAHPKGPSGPGTRRFPPVSPIPIRDNKQRDTVDKLQPLLIQSDVVPPGGTVHGFLFFDMSHDFDLVPYASLYVPDVVYVASNKALIYFEVPLRPRNSH